MKRKFRGKLFPNTGKLEKSRASKKSGKRCNSKIKWQAALFSTIFLKRHIKRLFRSLRWDYEILTGIFGCFENSLRAPFTDVLPPKIKSVSIDIVSIDIDQWSWMTVKTVSVKRQVQKSDRINSDRQSGSDQLRATRTNSDRIKNKNKIKLDSDQLGS